MPNAFSVVIFPSQSLMTASYHVITLCEKRIYLCVKIWARLGQATSANHGSPLCSRSGCSRDSIILYRLNRKLSFWGQMANNIKTNAVIIPNVLFPDTVRIAHLIEMGSSLLLFGLIVGNILRENDRSRKTAFNRACLRLRPQWRAWPSVYPLLKKVYKTTRC
jgi:hypothetical protein